MNKYLTCDTFVLQHGAVIKSEVIKDIQPIILTTEILENNGFTSHDVSSIDENGDECVSGKQIPTTANRCCVFANFVGVHHVPGSVHVRENVERII